MNTWSLHTHTCMRCGDDFFCLVPAQCKADKTVLPRVVVPGPNGPQIFEHVCTQKKPPDIEEKP